MRTEILTGNTDKALQTALLCFQCGVCTAGCPLNMFNGVKVNPRKLMRRIQLGQTPDIDPFLCMMCMMCEASCPRGVKITDIIRALRITAYEENRAPERLIQVLWRIYEEGNPWGYPAKDRGKWLEGVKGSNIKDKAKTLLYVGCISSYDIRLQRVVKSVVKLLSQSGIEFTVLGERERCCGDAVLNVGEIGFLEELIQDNIRLFKEKEAETIITISPHCYQIIRNIYPSYGGDFQVLHYSEYLAKLLDDGKLRIDTKYEGIITYHDPCYLGKYFGLFEEPRKLLEYVKGSRVEEMRMNKWLALCCGGGGGRIFMETKPEERPANMRIKQALETRAETLVTACPYCIINFEDSAKLQKTNLKIMDIAEILTFDGKR